MSSLVSYIPTLLGTRLSKRENAVCKTFTEFPMVDL